MRSIAATKIHEELHGRLNSRIKKIRNSNQLNLLNPTKSVNASRYQLNAWCDELKAAVKIYVLFIDSE